MQGQKFTHKNQQWIIVEIKTHSDNFRTQLGWTHFAAVKRPTGKQVYYTNLFIVNDEVAQANVIL